MKCVTKLSHRSSTTKVDGEGEGEEWEEGEGGGGGAGAAGGSSNNKRKRDDIEPILESHGQQVGGSHNRTDRGGVFPRNRSSASPPPHAPPRFLRESVR
eukprot:4959115-Prymnesium_polylepis.1